LNKSSQFRRKGLFLSLSLSLSLSLFLFLFLFLSLSLFLSQALPLVALGGSLVMLAAALNPKHGILTLTLTLTLTLNRETLSQTLTLSP